ncbi:MAG: FliA/WhiG family RNA polymerase sigma factor [Clostridia bacterium]|nr:FliA/WhiG family RNA polymerase sigma factor [Clostridia bacterium]
MNTQLARLLKSDPGDPENVKNDLDALWQDWFLHKNPDTRNELLLHYLYLVQRVVNRLFSESWPFHDRDDLTSCGIIGLMDALDRYKPKKGSTFETYAKIRIRGEIIDYMRRQDWAPVHLRTKIKKVQDAYEWLQQEAGEQIGEQDVAAYLKISPEEVRQILSQAHFLNIVYLEDVLLGGAEPEPQSEGHMQPDQQVEASEIQDRLAFEIKQLSEREQLILSLYYEEELTLKEIGRVLNLTESRVCQIHSSALARLRNQLTASENAKNQPQVLNKIDV